LRAGSATSTLVNGRESICGTYEKWIVTYIGGGKYTIKNKYWNAFLRHRPGFFELHMSTVEDVRSMWVFAKPAVESPSFIQDQVTLLNLSSGNWLTNYHIVSRVNRYIAAFRADSKGNAGVVLKGMDYRALMPNSDWYNWTFMRQSDGKYCIRSCGHFFRAPNPDDHTDMTDSATVCGSYERWTVSHEGNGWYTFKNKWGKYLTEGSKNSNTKVSAYKYDWALYKTTRSESPSFLNEHDDDGEESGSMVKKSLLRTRKSVRATK